jgi:rod shape-determining protein MreD
VMVLTLLLVQAAVLSWRRGLLGHRFVAQWAVFLLLAAAASALDWVLFCLLSLSVLPPAPMLFQAAVSVAIYPALAALLHLLRAVVHDPSAG